MAVSSGVGASAEPKTNAVRVKQCVGFLIAESFAVRHSCHGGRVTWKCRVRACKRLGIVALSEAVAGRSVTLWRARPCAPSTVPVIRSRRRGTGALQRVRGSDFDIRLPAQVIEIDAE